MLKVTPLNLISEIEAAERLRASHLKATASIKRDYANQFYREDRQPDAPAPENHAFEWFASITPSVINDNPVAAVTSRVSGVNRGTVKAIQHGVNQWTRDVELWTRLRSVWFDMGFEWGVMMTYFTDNPTYRPMNGLRAMRPSCVRIPPHRYLIDPRATGQEDARFQGHYFLRDKNDLEKDASYDQEVVRGLVADAELDKGQPAGEKMDGDAPARNEIAIYELWVPEVQLGDPDEGFNGAIYTIAVSQGKNSGNEPKWLRQPRPFYGPKWGPYTLFGCYVVPDQVYPLSPLAANYAQVVEYNAHATAAARSAARNKRFIAYDPANAKAGAALRDALDGGVVPVPGLNEKSVQQLDLGGVNKEQYDYLALLKARLDRSSGLGDTGRGIVDAEATATAVADAGEQRDARIAFIRQRFAECTSDVLYTAAWYIWHSEFSTFKLGEEAAIDLKPRPTDLPPEEDAGKLAPQINEPEDKLREALDWAPSLTYTGGESGPVVVDDETQEPLVESDASFDEMQLDVDPVSMARTNQPLQQKRMEDFIGNLINAVPLMATSPDIQWEEQFDDYGEALDRQDAGDAIRPYLKKLREAAKMQEAMGMATGAPPMDPNSVSATPGAPGMAEQPQNVDVGAMSGGMLAAAMQ